VVYRIPPGVIGVSLRASSSHGDLL